MMASPFALRTVPSCSLWDLARREAYCHKWLLSEQFGFDVGDHGLWDWAHNYWRIFCRYRRLDHLVGRRRISEFDDRSFGLLSDPRIIGQPVVRFVVKHFTEDGWENLDFYRVAPQHGVNFGELYDALSLVDVNSARFDPPW
jgi:hypothetical protein